jgi:hypothetical protein
MKKSSVKMKLDVGMKLSRRCDECEMGYHPSSALPLAAGGTIAGRDSPVLGSTFVKLPIHCDIAMPARQARPTTARSW